VRKLLVASKNPGKISELSSFLSRLPVKIASLNDEEITEDIEEDGKTYAQNSKKKALFYAKRSGLLTVADDAGLEIDALGGEPGVRSRRWLGYESTDEELIEQMKKISKKLPKENRKAKYTAVLTVATPDGKYFQTEGSVEGVISEEMNGEIHAGYPYDSFFYLPKIKKYYHVSTLTEKENQKYNHRYIAVKKLIPLIKQLL
jgi:XTP/dITP diphosphohydrolase